MTEQVSITSAGGVEIKRELVALGGRSYAFIIDWHVRFMFALAWFFFGVLFFTGDFTFKNTPDFDDLGTVFFFSVVVPSLVIYFLYHPVLEIMMNGRTPGKRMAGIRVVAKDGSSASGGAILLRNIFRLIDSLPTFYVLGIIVALVSKQHLRIGDMAAGTILVYEDRVNQKRVNMIMNSEKNNGLSTQNKELIAELLERWKELDGSTREKLAIQLLEKFNQPISSENETNSDKVLRDKLEKLIA